MCEEMINVKYWAGRLEEDIDLIREFLENTLNAKIDSSDEFFWAKRAGELENAIRTALIKLNTVESHVKKIKEIAERESY